MINLQTAVLLSLTGLALCALFKKRVAMQQVWIAHLWYSTKWLTRSFFLCGDCSTFLAWNLRWQLHRRVVVSDGRGCGFDSPGDWFFCVVVAQTVQSDLLRGRSRGGDAQGLAAKVRPAAAEQEEPQDPLVPESSWNQRNSGKNEPESVEKKNVKTFRSNLKPLWNLKFFLCLPFFVYIFSNSRQEEHCTDPLPDGVFFNGTQYCSLLDNARSYQHPCLEK